MRLAVIEARLYRINAALTGNLILSCIQESGHFAIKLSDSVGIVDTLVTGTKNDCGNFLLGFIKSLEITNRL